MVVNTPPAAVSYTVSEDVTITFRLFYPGGGSVALSSVQALQGPNTLLFTEAATGLYELHAELLDSAGNVGNTGPGASIQRLRVNAAPEVTLLETDTTPGHPLPLAAAVTDPDGDTPFSYLWEFGDGSPASTDQAPRHAFFHSGPWAQKSQYTVRVTVTDSAGKSSSHSVTVTVLNTTEGRLYADEHWSGVQVIRGSVLIPTGLRLQTAAGTLVQVSGDPLAGYDHRLTVEGTLEPGDGTRFALQEGVGSTWNGILVRGEAHFNGVEVRDAKRGITVTASASASVRDCRLEHNQIGLHVLGNGLSVERVRFAGNTLYAVKEDAGAEPSVRDCVFADNLYDYYDDQLTVIDVGRLNQKPGNSGNVSLGGTQP
jgi:PKD repeat protein